MIRVAVIDDHFIVRIGLRTIVETHADMTFAGEAESAEDVVTFLKQSRPDVLLLDVRMPGKDGLSALEEILSADPSQKVIMLTTSDADNDIFTAINLGAKGYLLKDRDAKAIVTAIRAVAEGGKFIPDAVRERYRERKMMDNFTPREKEILDLLVAGRTNAEIGEELGVSYEHIKAYSKRIFSKLGVHDRVNAVTESIRRGFTRINNEERRGNEE